jgi:hypothetical protein
MLSTFLQASLHNFTTEYIKNQVKTVTFSYYIKP